MDFYERVTKNAYEEEKKSFHSYAAFSDLHLRKVDEPLDHRLPYRRDVDRIIHSKAYRRYVDKTQVVYLVENDHLTHRSLHVQLVAHFAKGIAEMLKLNLDLVEAISLGHDVGHPPFGHEGEDYLSEIAVANGLSPFQHPIQSCRLLSLIEPLNLGLNVYDGFLSHDGAMDGSKIEPVFGKSWDRFYEDVEMKRKNPSMSVTPATLEGALVKICDTISYVGRDFEDAISIKIIERKDIPDTPAGNTNREWLTYFARDILKESFDKPYITMSKEAFQTLKTVRKFNFERIYTHPKLKTESAKIKESYGLLFQWLMKDWKDKGDKSHLSAKFLHSKSEAYLKASSDAEKVVDYISGMTDNYFVRTLENLIIPKRINLN